MIIGLDSIQFSPLLPLWAIIAMALLLSVPLVLSPKAVIRGRFVRLLLVAVIALVLLRPVIVQTEREEDENIALMLIDESGSQQLSGRIKTARAAAEALDIPENIRWEKIVIRDNEDTDSNQEGTALFTALNEALSQISTAHLAGVVIISDGIIHDENAKGTLDKLEAPIHSLLTGDPDLRDRRLVVEQAPQFGLVGKTVDVQIRVDDGPGQRGEAVTLRYRLNNGPEIETIARTGRSETIRIRPEYRGQNILHLSVGALANEVSTDNNQAILSISGVRDRLRVVLISGEPYQGERAWRATLKSDPAVDLVHFTILRLPSSQDFTPVQELSLIPFPSQQLFEEKLYDFDLVIFDRYTLRGVLQTRYLANLTSYVKAGGAVLVSVGPEFSQALSLANTPLAEILPAQPTGYVIDQRFRPSLTDTGKKHPVTATLPRLWGVNRQWGNWERMVDAQILSGQNLMSGPGGRPLLLLDRVGEGRIALLLSDQSWLWGKNIDGGGPQAEMVRRLAHWLMKEPDLEEEALKAQAQGRTISITRQSLEQTGGIVQLTDPYGNTQDVPLTAGEEGKNTATLEVEHHGLYRVSDGELQAFVATGALNNLEFSELRAKSDILEPLSKATGGGTFWLKDGMPSLRLVGKDATKAGRRWLGLQQNDAGRVLRVREIQMIPPWLALLLILATLALSWYRESR
ncbi:MAG: hypothetical protein PVF65_05870 [Sphingomonadales bacterium]|jgi:hypothetical protein